MFLNRIIGQNAKNIEQGVRVASIAHVSCVSLGKLLNFSGVQYTHKMGALGCITGS